MLLVSRHVRLVCSSSIATPSARGIIGRSIKHSANNVLPSNAIRPFFKDPPVKEDCPICFLPMPVRILSCISRPPATILSVPINDFAKANEELAGVGTERYYACCGKTICRGCIHSFQCSDNNKKCPFCNSDRSNKTVVEHVEDLMKRVEANDPASMFMLANSYQHGLNGLQQDHAKAMELYARSANLGNSMAHNNLAGVYNVGGDLKKAKFHLEDGRTRSGTIQPCLYRSEVWRYGTSC